ncbi:MAG: CoB--CoM heterodisulfide reductase iron-sulfur subunit A family protein [Spirochaetales bacterium]|nr:CoB--CoM heterodisulfide reductase iron-sulfur subunit A family protein [Spirochaetales bacterium]
MMNKGKATEKIEHGTVIIATGAKEYIPPDYLYGKDKRVVTQLELEEKIVKNEADIKECHTLVMIQCAGSRNEEHRYCSKVCCMQAVKNALKLKEINPEMEIFILYRDMRTYGFFEKYYMSARAKGITFLCYEKNNAPYVQQVTREGHNILNIEFHDMILDEKIAINTDILALSVPTVPPEGAGEIATLYKVPRNEDGFFLEAHVKLRPVDFATHGIFVCGLAHYPKDISEAISQAKAAAGRAVTILSKDTIEAEGKVSYVREDRCAGCGACVEVCAYHALTLNPEKGIVEVNEALCKGCGACAATCRSSAIDVKGIRDEQILLALESM